MSATTANSATPTSTTTANTTTMAPTTNTPTTPNTTTTTTGAAYTTTYPTSTTRTTTTCISNIIARGVLLLPRPMPSCQAHHHTDSRPRTGERLRFETAPKARHYLEKFLAGDARVPPLECLRPPQHAPVACDRLNTDATMDTEEVLGMRTKKKQTTDRCAVRVLVSGKFQRRPQQYVNGAHTRTHSVHTWHTKRMRNKSPPVVPDGHCKPHARLSIAPYLLDVYPRTCPSVLFSPSPPRIAQ